MRLHACVRLSHRFLMFTLHVIGVSVLCVFPLLAQAQSAREIRKLADEGQVELAMQRLDAALATKPKDAELRFLKGVLLSQQNRVDDAIATYVALTEEYPELAEPWNNLAVLYAAIGRYDKALSSLELAIKTRPGYAIAYENLGDVHVKLAAQSYEKAASFDSQNGLAKRKLALTRDVLIAPNQP